MNRYFIIIMIVLAVVVGAGIYGLHYAAPYFDFQALMIGDVMMALLCVLVFLVMKPQITGRPQAFLRGVLSGTMLKLFVCMAAFMTYIFMNRQQIQTIKPTIFALMGIYLIFTTVESVLTSKMAKYVK